MNLLLKATPTKFSMLFKHTIAKLSENLVAIAIPLSMVFLCHIIKGIGVNISNLWVYNNLQNSCTASTVIHSK